MFSQRYGRDIALTRHAQQRMAQRRIDLPLLLDLIETGAVRHKDASRVWLFKHYPDRGDNLLCAAAVIEDMLVIKTVMHHFRADLP